MKEKGKWYGLGGTVREKCSRCCYREKVLKEGQLEGKSYLG